MPFSQVFSAIQLENQLPRSLLTWESFCLVVLFHVRAPSVSVVFNHLYNNGHNHSPHFTFPCTLVCNDYRLLQWDFVWSESVRLGSYTRSINGVVRN